jgi:hypothetical protein
MRNGVKQGGSTYTIAQEMVLFEINGVAFEGNILAEGIDFRLDPDDDFFLEGGIYSRLAAPF